MLVNLMLKNKLLKLKLPNKINGTYSITNNDKTYINVESEDGVWKIKSNKNVKVMKTQEDFFKEVVLQKNSFFALKFLKTGEIGIIYCTDIYDMTFKQYKINSKEFSISNKQESSIQYKSDMINGQSFKMVNKNKYWTFETVGDSLAYINDAPVINPQVLKNGDVIFIYGLKLIYVSNFIYINNPANNVITNVGLLPASKENSVPFIEDDLELELETKEEQYFLRAPNIREVIERKTMKIDAPPAEEKVDDTPIAYVIGPMLSMGMISVVMLFSALTSFYSGSKNFMDIIPSLVIAFAILSGILIWPILNRRYRNKKKRKLEQKRQEKYNNYINSKSKKIDEIMLEQRKILNDNYPDFNECERIIIKKDMRLFERRIDNKDFIKVRIGIGNLPLDISINYPEEHFTMEDDNLVNILNRLVNKSKILENVPITYSLVDKKISAIIDEDNIIPKNNFLYNLLIQLTTFHSYDELKIVFLLRENSDIDIDYVRMLPHVWNNSKNFRFVADNIDDMKEISLYLEEVLQSRINSENGFVQKHKYTDYDNYYLIVIDDYQKAVNLQIVTDLLKLEENVGFSLLFVSDSINNLPNECTDFIDLKADKSSKFTSELSASDQVYFNVEKYSLENFYNATRVLNNIKIKFNSKNFMLPDSYEFLEMYKIYNVQQLNCLERWKKNDSTLSLKALLGIDINGEGIYLDVHEKYHGPHGLIAGMTGSGKSELIITYILSMAINYHPDDVNFILIDYKGGSLAGAFHNSQLGFKLPHLVGTITNLDTIEMNRSLSSIQSELNRRQKIFNEARSKLDEGTIDIYKYQKLYHEGVVSEPIAHLIIISDEFAELKTQQPEFMEQLIRVARIGRSLGVHLILATQRPSGIVNDQIRSNSRFSICLKVQDKTDSMDMIDRPDAASIKQTGRFYLQVGYNEYFILGQAAWSGAPYIPSNKMLKKIDTSISFVSNLGKIIKEANNIKIASNVSEGEQLNNIIKYLSNLAVSENISTRKLWLDKIPEFIMLEDIRKKYNHKYYYGLIEPVVGEYDDPFNQRQDILTIPLTKEGNAIVFGSADSGKELFISSMIYDIITSHHTNEINMYLFDFGSETLKKYIDAPQVGDVVTVENEEKITNFFYMIQKEITRRKSIISDSSESALDDLPMILVILNGYEVFKDNYEKFDEDLLNITRDCIKYKVNFILTASASNLIRYRLQQNFKLKYTLQLNDDNDYRNIYASAKKMKPSHIYGRGLVELEDNTYEFQTTHICQDESLNDYLSNVFDALKMKEKTSAKAVPVLPEVVQENYVKNYMSDLSKVPVGITKLDLTVETYDFKNKFITLLTGKRMDFLQEYLYGLFRLVSNLSNINLIAVDSNNVYSDKDCRFNYLNATEQLQLDPSKHNLICFMGIKTLKMHVEFYKTTIEALLEKLRKSNCSVVILDAVQQLKSVEFDPWYKNYVVNTEGIWVGSGIADQFVIKYNQSSNKLDNHCNMNFGYVVKNGNAKFIKLLEMSVEDE